MQVVGRLFILVMFLKQRVEFSSAWHREVFSECE
jgi:hypothetical protein